ncbi:MAG: cupin domain-containing protein [Gemmatimonadetes bacterium]|nr:cupin domain-containing protein [Gemmatimonadota bacterium]
MDQGRDTGHRGAYFLIEQTHATRGGGPPRHFHFEQDEWFYSLEGDYVVEIDGKRHELSTGDSILAPRRLPHTFAFAGPTTGRLLVGFTPAGRMEEFFVDQLSRGSFLGSGTDADRARLREYGMQNVGPPLQL